MSVNASEISVWAGKAQLLHNVSFAAQPGQVTAIVGPSGAGKTTLIAALSGDVAYEGSISLNGMDIRAASYANLASQRAVLAQATPLAFPFTVLEIVRLGLTNGASTAIAHEALARVGMSGFEGQYFQSLSGGEQQRVQLARVLCQVWHPVEDGEPKWLFLDEPVSSLDIGQQLRVLQVARRFADQGGGVVAVMHDLNLTAMFADQVALICDGKLVVQDAPSKALTSDRLSDAYGCEVQVSAAPDAGFFVLPQMAQVTLGA